MAGVSIWSKESIARLKELWNGTDPQLSTAEIGRRMGMSKNAIVGKVHRLELDARPSPIKRGSAWEAKLNAPSRRLPLAGSTLPSTPSEIAAVAASLLDSEVLPPLPSEPPPKPLPVVKFKPYEPPPPPEPTRFRRSERMCCWPVGQGRPTLFCEAPIGPDVPYRVSYCEVHQGKAYQKIRSRAEACDGDVAAL
jgi:GcrA cell cycle regulator